MVETEKYHVGSSYADVLMSMNCVGIANMMAGNIEKAWMQFHMYKQYDFQKAYCGSLRFNDIENRHGTELEFLKLIIAMFGNQTENLPS
jgi:hypothetical protein